jgi:hypothetical protein
MIIDTKPTRSPWSIFANRSAAGTVSGKCVRSRSNQPSRFLRKHQTYPAARRTTRQEATSFKIKKEL